MPKNALILLKNRKNRRALGALPPDPLASGGWGFSPQTSATAPFPPHDDFLATCLLALPSFKHKKRCYFRTNIKLFSEYKHILGSFPDPVITILPTPMRP